MQCTYNLILMRVRANHCCCGKAANITYTDGVSYVYWTVHHLDSWVKRCQLDITCFIISLFNAQHVSDVNTSILRNLRLICWVISWVVLLWFDVCWCYVVVRLWWCGIRMQAEAVPHPAYGYRTTTAEPQRNTNTHRTRAMQPMKSQQISRKLLRMDVLTSETCWTLNNEIIKKVTSSWSFFTQLYWQCVCSLRYPVRNAHVPYYHLRPAPL